MASNSGRSGGVKGIGLVTIIFGIIFIAAGAVTWGAVSTNLAAEKITVSDDASAFQGQLVDTPWEAWVQADIINTHALEATDGKTYAELPQDDPARDTVMTASFLRASLFTSVVAFGVGLLVVGIGVVLLLVGFALRKTGSRLAAIDGSTAEVTHPYKQPDPVVAAPTAAPVAATPAREPAAAPPAAPPAAAPVTAPPAAAPPAAAPAAAAPTTTTPSATSGSSSAPLAADAAPAHGNHAAADESTPDEPTAPRSV